MPKAYWVNTCHAIHDADKMAAYARLAGPAVAAAGGRFLSRGVAARAFEAGRVERTTVIECPSLQAAIAAHDTPDYKAALEALGDGATRDCRIVEGVE